MGLKWRRWADGWRSYNPAHVYPSAPAPGFSVVDGTLKLTMWWLLPPPTTNQPWASRSIQPVRGGPSFTRRRGVRASKPVIGARCLCGGWAGPICRCQPARHAVSPNAQSLPRVLLLGAKPQRGYLHLNELLARGWTRNVVRDQAVLTWNGCRRAERGADSAQPGANAGPVGMAYWRVTCRQGRARGPPGRRRVCQALLSGAATRRPPRRRAHERWPRCNWRPA